MKHTRKTATNKKLLMELVKQWNKEDKLKKEQLNNNKKQENETINSNSNKD